MTPCDVKYRMLTEIGAIYLLQSKKGGREGGREGEER